MIQINRPAYGLLFLLGAGLPSLAQNPAALSESFEGKPVVIKLDMPATQQGVDVYPQRPQPLDLNSYSKRLKQFGTALRNGDSVLVTKVRVKDNNIEFQLAGGGYGTAFDDTDTSPHYTSSDKSGREKQLDAEIKGETDPNKRRSLQRQLDDERSRRERRDDRDRIAADEAAEMKKQRIGDKRLQGGSRFNIRVDTRANPEVLTPGYVVKALEPYVAFASGEGGRPMAGASSAEAADPVKSLKKGLTREQVESLLGPANRVSEHSEGGMNITSCTYTGKDELVEADFINGVLVQYKLSSR